MPTRRTYVLTLTVLLVSSLAIALLSRGSSLVGAAVPGTAAPGVQTTSPAVLPIEEFSPGFLGVYRKVMEIEDEIVEDASKYGVDLVLARAVCMYESGGNANLSSSAGAQGYFQVMGPTFRSMRVRTNIEAGIKYLSQQIARFDREDYALAAYNGGPSRVARGGAMPLESLQYVLGVGHYRSVLRTHEASARAHAATLQLETVRGRGRLVGIVSTPRRAARRIETAQPVPRGSDAEARQSDRVSVRFPARSAHDGRGRRPAVRDPPWRQLFQRGLHAGRRPRPAAQYQRALAAAVPAARPELTIPLNTTAAFTEYRVRYS